MNEKKNLPTLLERVQSCHKDLGVTYKAMRLACEIPESTFYQFTRGMRDLRGDRVLTLDKYLSALGY